MKRTFSNFNENGINDPNLLGKKKIKEDHYYSKKNLIFEPYNMDAEELFGLNHSLYLNHNQFVTLFIGNKENNLSFLDSLALEKPFKLSNHFYLINLGHFYFTKQNDLAIENSNGEAILQFNNEEILTFGDGFCSYRMYKSFMNKGLLVYYYQTKVFIKEIDTTFYVLLPEDCLDQFHNNDLFFFHTNLNELVEFVFKKMKEIQTNETVFRPYRFMQNKRCLFPTILPEILYEKILKKNSIGNKRNLTLNLEDTYVKLVGMTGMTPSLCDSLEPLINQFFESQLKKLGLPKMHLGDFFFGYNHPKVNALVHLIKKNRNASSRLPESLKGIFTDLSPYLKLKQKLTYNDLQDNKIPLPYKASRLYFKF